MAQPAYDRSVVIYVDLCCVLEEFHLSDRKQLNLDTIQMHYSIILYCTLLYTLQSPTFHDIYGFPYFFTLHIYYILYFKKNIM